MPAKAPGTKENRITFSVREQLTDVPRFIKFYFKLLEDIANNLKVLSNFGTPTNRIILEEFQKYISQASVEPYSIKRRDRFLDKAFKDYRSPKTAGRIVGGEIEAQ
jgi:hypothetical protein